MEMSPGDLESVLCVRITVGGAELSTLNLLSRFAPTRTLGRMSDARQAAACHYCQVTTQI